MSLLLSCQSISKAFGHRPLFTGITLGVYEGQRIGLIGPNGSGKSTFLRILAELETLDGGEITRRRDLRVGFVAQKDDFAPDATVRSVLLGSLRDHHMEDHDRETRAAKLITKMGFANPDQPAAELSGGWRKRLAIARELVAEPELLLLDEPTNHLDLEGIVWLEKLLEGARFATLVVSHDRYFLENMTTRIVEINRAYPDGFFGCEGTYSDFLERREDFLAAQKSQETSMANKMRREAEWLKRGPKARRTKAKSRIEDAGILAAELKETRARNNAFSGVAKLEFSGTERKTNKLIAAHNLQKTLGGRTLFSKLDFILSPGSRVGILGPNGSGKSTLLRLLTGELEPDSGTIKKAADLKVVYFDQARQGVDRSLTLKEALSPKSDSVVLGDQVIHVNTWAKRFLFTYEQLNVPVGSLSGGEQARVVIAQLMLRPADVLILDEPTNDLDIPTLEVIEETLEEFPGALVLVTHDRFMLDRLCSELIGLDGGGEAGIYTDLSQWERAVEARRQLAAAAAKAEAAKVEKPKPATSGKKKLSYMEQREWEGMELKILEAEEALEKEKKRMEDPAVLADRVKLADACEKMHAAEELVRTLYARWAELEAKQAG